MSRAVLVLGVKPQQKQIAEPNTEWRYVLRTLDNCVHFICNAVRRNQHKFLHNELKFIHKFSTTVSMRGKHSIYPSTKWVLIIISIQPEGRFWQEPEPSQATGMALAHCILGSFLGVVCHCFPPSGFYLTLII